jgi:hypothetical protein
MSNHLSRRFLVRHGLVLGIVPSLTLGATACAAGHQCHMHSLPSAFGSSAGLSASGIGEAKAAPDIARVSIGVELRAQTADQASERANAQMTAVLAAVKALGVADKDLRTHDFSIDFEREPTPPALQPETAASRGRSSTAAPAQVVLEPRGLYRVQNMVEVTVRDLDKVGKVLGAATSAGANNVWGVSFELEDSHALSLQARTNAFEDAKRNATEMARLAGVSLGKVISISEGESRSGPRPAMLAMRAQVAEASDVPIERGQLSLTHTVQIMYALPEP